jgi:hypothetical protein
MALPELLARVQALALRHDSGRIRCARFEPGFRTGLLGTLPFGHSACPCGSSPTRAPAPLRLTPLLELSEGHKRTFHVRARHGIGWKIGRFWQVFDLDDVASGGPTGTEEDPPEAR